MTAYQAAGVDIEAGKQATELMARAVQATYTPAVLAGMGAFAGCIDLGQALAAYREPVLVASTDGVGTKTLVAARLGRFTSVGQDLVYHCVNDLLVQGARPLFFMDYVAAARLDAQQAADVVRGVAEACRSVGCVLLGGETAEMPQVYQEGAFDLAGTMVGLVEKADILPRSVAAGDLVLALPSTGLHTNGYSLARRLVEPLGYTACPPELDGQMIGEALLAIHRPYLLEVERLREAVDLRALAHITGGGVYDNLPRVLPAALGALIRRGTWKEPGIFGLLCRLGALSTREAFHTLNMGLGMLVIVRPEDAVEALDTLPALRQVGELVEWDGAGERVRVLE
jgi:phosphoribosylformylglycinamidine cyclo-ligase